MVKKRLSILVAEDDVQLGELLEDGLTHAGFMVTRVSDGLAACDQVTRSIFDVVVLDSLLPGMDGYGVMDFMKKRHVATPILFLSNINSAQDIARAMDGGAVDFLIKSDTQMKELVEKIRKIV